MERVGNAFKNDTCKLGVAVSVDKWFEILFLIYKVFVTLNLYSLSVVMTSE